MHTSTLSSENPQWTFRIYASPLPFPFNAALHTWIVTISPEEGVNRYEIYHFKNPYSDHLHMNRDDEQVGLKKFVWNQEIKNTGKLEYEISGTEGSLAEKIVRYVSTNINQYEHISEYHMFLGPNCNTLTQSLLNKFPEIDYTLPWNAYSGNDFIQNLRVNASQIKLPQLT